MSGWLFFSHVVTQLVKAMDDAVDVVQRLLMLERQREGIAKAKAEGMYQGRAPTARRKVDDIKR